MGIGLGPSLVASVAASDLGRPGRVWACRGELAAGTGLSAGMGAMMPLTVKDYEKHQHFTRRRPTWIKLHHRLLDDRTFNTLPLESQALLPKVWLIASEYTNGEITERYEDLAWRCKVDEGVFLAAMQACVAAKLIRWPEIEGLTHERGIQKKRGLSSSKKRQIRPNQNNLKQSKATDDSESESEAEAEVIINTESVDSAFRRDSRKREPPDGRQLTMIDDIDDQAAVDRKSSGKGTRLPQSWQPSDKDALYAKSKGLDPEAVAEDFRDYWHSVAGVAGLKADWPATWRRRCRQLVEARGSPVNGRQVNGASHDSRPSWEIERQRRIKEAAREDT
jgi:hypothetical protein